MKTKNKPKWIIIQQWGSRKNFPIMPATLTVMKEATGKKFAQIYKTKIWGCINYYNDKENYTRLYAREDEWQRFCNQCYQKIKKDPEIQKRVNKEFQKRVPKFLNFCRKVYQTNLREKSNKELWQYYEKYIRLYEDLFIWGESFAFGSRFQLSDYLSEYLKKILEKRNQSEKFDQYFNTLITPKEKPFITEEREKLLKIGLKILKNSKLKNLFQKNLKVIQKEITKYLIDKEIEKHKKNYQWIPYNYGAYLYTKRYFLKELRNLIIKIKIKEELNNIKRNFYRLEQRQKKIIQELKINKYHLKLFEALRSNSFIIDYKKRVFTISHFYINFSLMKEIAKRLKIKQDLAHCLLEKEVKNALVNNKKISKKILEERYKKTVIFIKNDKVKLMTGKEAEKFLKNQEIKEEKKIRIKEIKGQIANSGFVKGKVKVILTPNSKNFKEMNKGDILVTHMTTPEFTPVIRKAAAIITDEGGITSHAAIISRELNIPCIIGIKIATKVLKDGDLVEVDANHGIVKLIKT
jgi:pyruvate,water dikinase